MIIIHINQVTVGDMNRRRQITPKSNLNVAKLPRDVAVTMFVHFTDQRSVKVSSSSSRPGSHFLCLFLSFLDVSPIFSFGSLFSRKCLNDTENQISCYLKALESLS